MEIRMKTTSSGNKKKQRKEFQPCCENQVIVYECESCGIQEERMMGEGYLIERACPNFPECCTHYPAGSSGPHAGEPLGASDMRVAGMNCWDHGWQPAPHQHRRTQLTIYDKT